MTNLNRKTTNRRKRYRKHFLTSRLFFTTLTIFFILGLCLPLRPSKSADEKRELTKFPKFTVESFLDGAYFNQISLWYADSFPFRDALIGMNSKLKSLYGIQDVTLVKNTKKKADEIPKDLAKNTEEKTKDKKANTEKIKKKDPVKSEPKLEEKLKDGTIYDVPETVGDIFITKGTGFSLYYFNQEGADMYASMVDMIQKAVPGSQVYDILAPTAVGVQLDEKIQEQLGSSNQEESFNYIEKSIESKNKKVRVINTIDKLKKHNADYLYFRTDHHWTQLGAYYAYQEFAKAKGVEAIKLEDMNKLEFKGFLGTHYAASNKSQELAKNPDTIIAYYPKSTNDLTYIDKDGNSIKWPIVVDVTGWARGAMYSTFIGGDNPLAIIDNPKISNGENAVFIKESYGNAFVPFLVDHYDKVFVVDYRYFYQYDKYNNDLKSFINNNKIKDVILLNNSEAMTYDVRIKQISAMFGN